MCCYSLQLATQANWTYRKHACRYRSALLAVSLDLPCKLFGVEENGQLKRRFLGSVEALT